MSLAKFQEQLTRLFLGGDSVKQVRQVPLSVVPAKDKPVIVTAIHTQMGELLGIYSDGQVYKYDRVKKAWSLF